MMIKASHNELAFLLIIRMEKKLFTSGLIFFVMNNDLIERNLNFIAIEKKLHFFV